MNNDIRTPFNKWHTLSKEDALDQLVVDSEKGLSNQQVDDRRAQFGKNEIIEKEQKSPWVILFSQFQDTMVLVLIGAAAISVLISDWKDALVILAIVILNAVVGFMQEYRAEQAMAALRQMAAPIVKVRRGGHLLEIAAQELVPGDIIFLEAGSAIPADARLIEAVNLRVEEASLTGESHPVDKNIAPLNDEMLPVGDRQNMVFMGTIVSFGRGSAVVTSTGMNTQLGNIATMIQDVAEDKTPLQKRMAELGRSLAIAALAIVGIVFVLGLLRGENPAEMFLTAIAMAVAAVPEGLPAVVAIALALGAQRMLKRNALIRKLPAVETLGSVTVIASDKTGTLTQNKMMVQMIDVAGQTIEIEQAQEINESIPFEELNPAMSLMLIGGSLSNDAVLDIDDEGRNYRPIGDPTEAALLMAAAQYGISKQDLEAIFPRIHELPFSSERKRMTTVHAPQFDRSDSALSIKMKELFFGQQPVRAVRFTKGAADNLLDISTHIWVSGKTQEITPEWRERIENANMHMASKGLRVLGVAFQYQDDDGKIDNDRLEEDLIFVGMFGMMDPPRPEVADAVRTCLTAGIRPIMITGDHPVTAQRIAADLGIDTSGGLITGRELAEMSVEDIENVVESTSVYARVSPEHKLKIVTALQNRGHIVAMTGDGVNDAPALRKSDIGVAMGITGTDVSKEAGDMVLLDDNFATIVNAVKEGRTIYENVRKFIKYTMTSNAGEIYVMLLTPFIGMPLPLTAIQILWINLVTDGLPGLALSVEPSEKNTMDRPPHPPTESIFARGLGFHVIWVGLLMGLVSLGIGYWGWINNNPLWPTMLFTTLTLAQMGHAMAIRSSHESLFRQGLFSNRPILLAVSLTFALQMLVVYWPPMQQIFDTQALPLPMLAISLGVSLTVFVAVEIEKWIKRSRNA